MRSFLITWLSACLMLPVAAVQAKEADSARTAAPAHAKSSSRTVASTSYRVQHVYVPAHPQKGVKSQTRFNRQHAAVKESTKVVNRAINVLGTPYRWGGTTPKKGFDCSGLVNYAYRDVKNLDLPRTSRELARVKGLKVERKNLKPGDLVFFKINGRGIDHVAIYLGHDRFIHAPRRGENVRIDHLSKPYWQKRFASAKRVLPQTIASSETARTRPATSRKS
ncbi:cell wall-associated NlpC family hydrolase [Pseudomonas duriflava]|uniref:Cell wall-associated NlpC family hydrolase n=1 Tax=Pseudomonas duriflava TaxID=459528 RepID=A0A562QNQ8_9PSED|nr:C40 family peptidase [Pseudomonas duriflava]TWI58398.1 cell wall-associated NlpC family hydrolase [Pseudomonas duriflava]